MRTIHFSTKAAKDLKRYRNNPRKMRKLHEVLELLINDEPLPASYRAHRLTGVYRGCMECHIESDLLLIWIDEETNTIEVLRLGSHSELF